MLISDTSESEPGAMGEASPRRPAPPGRDEGLGANHGAGGSDVSQRGSLLGPEHALVMYDIAPAGVVSLQRSICSHVAILMGAFLVGGVLVKCEALSWLRPLGGVYTHLRDLEISAGVNECDALRVEATLALEVGGAWQCIVLISFIALQLVVVSVAQRHGATDSVAHVSAALHRGDDEVRGCDGRSSRCAAQLRRCGAARACRRGCALVRWLRGTSSTRSSLSSRMPVVMSLVGLLVVFERLLYTVDAVPMLFLPPDRVVVMNTTSTDGQTKVMPSGVGWTQPFASLSGMALLAALDSFVLETLVLLVRGVHAGASGQARLGIYSLAYGCYGALGLARFLPSGVSSIALVGAVTISSAPAAWGLLSTLRCCSCGQRPTVVRSTGLTGGSDPASDSRGPAFPSRGRSGSEHLFSGHVGGFGRGLSEGSGSVDQEFSRELVLAIRAEQDAAAATLRSVGKIIFSGWALALVVHLFSRTLDRAKFRSSLVPVIETAAMLIKGALLPPAAFLAVWSIQQRYLVRVAELCRLEAQNSKLQREQQLLRYLCHELRSPLNTLSFLGLELEDAGCGGGRAPAAGALETGSQHMFEHGRGYRIGQLPPSSNAAGCAVTNGEQQPHCSVGCESDLTITAGVAAAAGERAGDGELRSTLAISSSTLQGAVAEIRSALDNILLLDSARTGLHASRTLVEFEVLQLLSQAAARYSGVLADIEMSARTMRWPPSLRSPSAPQPGRRTGRSVAPLPTIPETGAPSPTRSGHPLVVDEPLLAGTRFVGDVRGLLHVLNTFLSNATRFGLRAGDADRECGQQNPQQPRSAHRGLSALERAEPLAHSQQVAGLASHPSSQLVHFVGHDADQQHPTPLGGISVRATVVRGVKWRAHRSHGAVALRPPRSSPVNELDDARECSLGGAVLLVEVADAGVGIEQEDLPRLFREFQMIRSAARIKNNSTGLGLAVARLIVASMHGRIGAWSDGPGRGAVFWFAVPVRLVHLPAAMRVEEAVSTAQDHDQPGGRRNGSDSFSQTVGAAGLRPIGDDVAQSHRRPADAAATDSPGPHSPSCAPDALLRCVGHVPDAAERSSAAHSCHPGNVTHMNDSGNISLTSRPIAITSSITLQSASSSLLGLPEAARTTASRVASAESPQGLTLSALSSEHSPQFGRVRRQGHSPPKLPTCDFPSKMLASPPDSPSRLPRLRHVSVGGPGTRLAPLRVVADSTARLADSGAPFPPTSRDHSELRIPSTDQSRCKLNAACLAGDEHTSDHTPAGTQASPAAPSHSATDGPDAARAHCHTSKLPLASGLGGNEGDMPASHSTSIVCNTAARTPTASAGRPLASVLRAIVVDDVALNCRLLGQLLHRCGVGQVMLAEDGADALRQLQVLAASMSSDVATGNESSAGADAHSCVRLPLAAAPSPSITGSPSTLTTAPAPGSIPTDALDADGGNASHHAVRTMDLHTAPAVMPQRVLHASSGHTRRVIGSAPFSRLHVSVPIVLTDQEMPVCNGKQLARSLRDGGYQGVILGVTGNAFSSDVRDFVTAGADEVLIKPVARTTLVDAVLTLIERVPVETVQ